MEEPNGLILSPSTRRLRPDDARVSVQAVPFSSLSACSSTYYTGNPKRNLEGKEAPNRLWRETSIIIGRLTAIAVPKSDTKSLCIIT